MIHPLTGVIPVVPTIFHDNEDLDLAGLRRVVDFLIDCRPNALCILANYSEQFSLTDDERDMIARCIIDHNACRLPIVVTTSHYSARVAAGRSKRSGARRRPRDADATILRRDHVGTRPRDHPAISTSWHQRSTFPS